jgi:hypothetical protein
MTIGTCNVSTLYRAGAMKELVKEMYEYEVGTAIKENYVILYS